ncbi:hypothetical protein HKBW3S25_00419 [Candidatus Hakubella thermalkaliphila]|uniref:Uncharacterized protein n=1 Tax=Candidatus Hakubella thermalkaliphila TaxID=2754717 RepID=A0A6V8P0J2_9ACTN|nr:hypothetical protein HKBW3S25_00419 [Candidatus Hakubella thermalkaliphila]
MPKIAFFTAFNCGIPEVESFQKEILPDILVEFDVDLFTTDLSIPLPPELDILSKHGFPGGDKNLGFWVCR